MQIRETIDKPSTASIESTPEDVSCLWTTPGSPTECSTRSARRRDPSDLRSALVLENAMSSVTLIVGYGLACLSLYALTAWLFRTELVEVLDAYRSRARWSC